jgi:hypothetical protein
MIPVQTADSFFMAASEKKEPSTGEGGTFSSISSLARVTLAPDGGGFRP